MFWVRFRSAVILTVIALVALIKGSYLLFGISLIISIIGLRELYKVFKIENTKLPYDCNTVLASCPAINEQISKIKDTKVSGMAKEIIIMNYCELLYHQARVSKILSFSNIVLKIVNISIVNTQKKLYNSIIQLNYCKIKRFKKICERQTAYV